MRNPSILIWEHCAPPLQAALQEFQRRWRPSSEGTSKHTLQLLQKLIEPAISASSALFPKRYLSFLPGASSAESFGEIIDKRGLAAMAVIQRRLLDAFRSTVHSGSDVDTSFVSTCETLIGLITACIRKTPTKVHVADTRFSRERGREYCRFCGTPTEFTLFAENADLVEIYYPKGHDNSSDKTMHLSSLYCIEHRPKQKNENTWNPRYQRAKRLENIFDEELKRLRLQAAKLNDLHAKSGDALVDAYIYLFIRKLALQPADEPEIRQLARLMVDRNFSDRKKKICLLHQYGITQSDIARIMGLERQHVFRDLKSIGRTDIFAGIPIPKDFFPQLKELIRSACSKVAI